MKFEDLTREESVSSIQNKLPAKSFYLMGDIEKYGTGFIRIRKFFEEYQDEKIINKDNFNNLTKTDKDRI
ncbi:MAG: hypothetical protein KKE44_09830 [Proteobacteria bacterium]|nr:hypothetical protein [Pseudomonadota bacterium]MBU1583023.1 hypothetical protein [Pseudomonadota bacterium]MBU2454791.1 hypothetical protein [Pseudomonadota bacterium]MBU2627941.1 hypothetical protein [Pseudomonadota bacterium]